MRGQVIGAAEVVDQVHMVDIDQSDQSPLAVPLLARSSGKKLGSNRCRSIRIARASFLRLGAFFFPSPRMALKASVSFVPLPSSSSSPYRAAPSRRVLLVTRMLRNSFLNGGVGSLKAREINSSRIKQLKCHPYGGGSLVVQMNLFDRLARVVKSYANAILSSMEDPEKILDQAVLEMNDDLTKMRQATAQVLASQKRLENKYKATQQASDEWYRKAQLALGKGDEDLAREALKRRKSYAVVMAKSELHPKLMDVLIYRLYKTVEIVMHLLVVSFLAHVDNASSLKAQLDQQRAVVDNLVSNTKLLESKIQEARSKKDTLKARAQSAKTATKVSEMLGNVDTSSALSAFEKMEEKALHELFAVNSCAHSLGFFCNIRDAAYALQLNTEVVSSFFISLLLFLVLAMESQAEALNQLTTDDLEGKFALLESSSVEDDLATLKKELSGRSPKGELPAGRTAVSSSNISSPFRDMDIERELNELRKKANEY
ncbi:hypothetical protein ZIOFF_075577 [Zingiber officinale]|uniref:Uncharacterized protein n=1 Tax=Zingiber officinale TaxID=94328 RepID=A0A8J5BTL5_ZINOF|nr:hypothetical protein ZIOFF_075577 [Zingiber officinale]